eukprot:COSAG02_NODE_666_length_18722_cov_237.372765_12_plen_74_part_00
MKWLAMVDNGTSIETCPYFARTITLVASSVMVLRGKETPPSLPLRGWLAGCHVAAGSHVCFVVASNEFFLGYS